MLKTHKFIQPFLFTLLVFFLPTQLAKFFWPDWALVFGIRIDYIAPKLYFTDLLIAGLLLAELFKRKLNVYQIISIMALTLFAALFFIKPTRELFGWVTLLKFVALGALIQKNYKEWFPLIFKPLALVSVLLSGLSFLQFLFQKTLGGPFYWLGERSFTSSAPGIALFDIAGRQFLRPYATFPHPNVLAAFALISFLLLFQQTKKTNLTKVAMLFCILLVILSYSQNAWLASFIVLLFFLIKERAKAFNIYLLAVALGSLLLPILAAGKLAALNLPTSLAARLSQSVIAGELFATSPLFGVGFGNFIPSSYLVLKVFPSLFVSFPFVYLQPVHNIFLLILAETGILGFLLLLSVFFKAGERAVQHLAILPLVAIVSLGIFDHYFLTLQQGQLLLTFVIAFCMAKKK